MTDQEQLVWVYLLNNRKATDEEVAAACGVSPEYVRACINKAGTSESVWRYGGEVSMQPARQRLLRTAEQLTTGDRNKTYGPPFENMDHIAQIFNAWTGHSLTAADIARVHIATKMARRTTSPLHEDSYVDDMAYVGIEYECVLAEAKDAEKS